MFQLLVLLDLMVEQESKPVGLVYIGVKKNNKILITKNIFKQKSRKAIQKATVKRTIRIIKSLI